jgi:hypothetical protein
MSAHCGKKVKHPTRETALEHVKALLAKNHARGQSERSANLGVYPCDECGAWHVGHHPTAPLVWHYTIGLRLEPILADNFLKPARPRLYSKKKKFRRLSRVEREQLKVFDEPAPLLWFSRNLDWEYSVQKGEMKPGVLARGRIDHEIAGRGLVRFGVPASFAKLRWSDYLRLNPTPNNVRDAMARSGNPVEWLATDEPVSLKWARAIQVHYRGAWVNVGDVTDEEFDRYLAWCPAIYEEAYRTFFAKSGKIPGLKAARPVPQYFAEAERIVEEDEKQRRKEDETLVAK